MYGNWPSRIVAVRPMTMGAVGSLFLPESFARLAKQIELVERADFDGESWDGYFYAEDDDGNRSLYSDAHSARSLPPLSEVEGWLGVAGPDAPHGEH